MGGGGIGATIGGSGSGIGATIGGSGGGIGGGGIGGGGIGGGPPGPSPGYAIGGSVLRHPRSAAPVSVTTSAPMMGRTSGGPEGGGVGRTLVREPMPYFRGRKRPPSTRTLAAVRTQLSRHHGVLAAHAKARAEVAPRGAASATIEPVQLGLAFDASGTREPSSASESSSTSEHLAIHGVEDGRYSGVGTTGSTLRGQVAIAS